VGSASSVTVLAGTGVPSRPAAVEGISLPTCVPPHEQLLVGLRQVIIGLSSAGHTLDPPYEQLLIRLGGGDGLMFCVRGGHCVSVTWHPEGGWLVLT
jgi:hypothetical protein